VVCGASGRPSVKRTIKQWASGGDVAPRRQVIASTDAIVKPCYTRDEGSTLGAAMQVEAPNHLKLRWTKATVMNVKGKVGAKTSAGMFYGDD